MYRLRINGNMLFDPDYEDYTIENGTLKMSANKLATLTFTIYPNNPQYNQIQKLLDVITVYRDNAIIAAVRPVKTKLNFRGGLEYTCEDVLARLNDLLRRPGTVQGKTQAEYLEALIEAYNAQYTAQVLPTPFTVPVRYGQRNNNVRAMQAALVKIGYKLPRYGVDGYFKDETLSAVKAFQTDHKNDVTPALVVDGVFDTEEYNILMGILTPDPVTVSPVIFEFGSAPHSTSNTANYVNDEYIGYWDLMQKHLVEEYGGYIMPVYSIDSETGKLKCTIHYTDDEHLTASEQEIIFGDNLADLFVESDSEETFSVLIPLGKDTAKNRPLTIASVNSGNDYLESEIGLGLYGRRERTYRWDDVTSAATLKTKGEEYLAENAVKLKEKITLSAIDLRYAGADIDYLDFLTMVHVASDNHDVDEDYPITEMQISLNSPTASKLTIGAETLTFTDRMIFNVRGASDENRRINARLFDLEHPT